MEKVVHKFSSFKEQEKYEKDYWLNASLQEKFEAVETIRAIYISTFCSNIQVIEKIVRIKKFGEE